MKEGVMLMLNGYGRKVLRMVIMWTMWTAMAMTRAMLLTFPLLWENGSSFATVF
jgi:hypothetical protein